MRNFEIKNIHKDIILCITTVVFAAVVFAVFGMGKRIIFCDEVYTYTITNSDKAIYQFTENEWYTGEEIKDMVVHTEGDSIGQMLTNVKGDKVHPPLYYAMVYGASAIAGSSLSKWTGLSVNLIFFLGTTGCIWWILRKLFNSPWIAVGGTVVYICNISTVSDMTLVRMYMMLTFWTAAFAYINYLLLEHKEKKSLYVLLAVVTAGGFLTQYYFALFAVGFFLVEGGIALLRKEYKRVLSYLAAMVAAVAASTLLWPFWIKAVIGNTHSAAMAEKALHISGIFTGIAGGIRMVLLTIFQKGYIAGGIGIVAVLVFFFLSKRIKEQLPLAKEYVIRLILAMIIYAGIVNYLTPDYLASTRYYYPAAMLAILMVLIGVYSIVKVYGKSYMYFLAGGAGIAVNMVVLFLGTGIDYYGNAQEYDAQREVLEQYADIPWIISGGESWQVSANLFDFTIAKEAMVISDQTAYRQEEKLEETEEFLIIAYDEYYKNSDMALYYYIGCTGNFVTDELLFVRNGLSVYLAHPQVETE